MGAVHGRATNIKREEIRSNKNLASKGVRVMKKTATLVEDNGESKPIYVLLYGTGEAGKTTLLRQLARIFHFPLQEKSQDLKPLILDNIVRGTLLILQAATDKLNIRFKGVAKSYVDAVNKAYDEHRRNIMLGGSTYIGIDLNLAQSIYNLLSDRSFREAMKHRAMFQLEDTWEFFAQRLANFPSWGGEQWLPNDEEILHSRLRTTGLNDQVKFKLSGREFRISDVGGQRSERNKFIANFIGVDCIIHLVAISEYDQTCFEDESTNRIIEALTLWEQTVNNKKFQKTLFILLFNKIDVFTWKYHDLAIPIRIPDLSFHKAPPIHSEDNENCSKALHWFEQLFTSRISTKKNADVYVDNLTALSRDQTSEVIQRCMLKVLNELDSRRLREENI